MQMITGLKPPRPEWLEMKAERTFEANAIDRSTVVQPVAWIRDQVVKPSCIGQYLAAGIDSVLGEPPWASAVDIWEDARRRQGNAEGVLSGTRAEYAIASVMRRGWSPYTPGEDRRSFDEDGDGRASSLADELFAHDTRQLNAINYDIRRNKVASVLQALRAGFIVGGAWGLQDKFGSAPRNTVLGPDYLDADKDFHEMRLFCYVEQLRAFGVQNSWGEGVGGFRLGDREYRGCYLISEEALEASIDVDVIEIKRPQ